MVCTRFVAVWLVVSSMLPARIASGEEVDSSEAREVELRVATDSNHRAEAARALGMLDDQRGLVPLCEALDDSSELVRCAAADALKMLGNRAALECLRNRGGEPSSLVQQRVNEAVRALESSAPPAPKKGDKVYVAFGTITNGTGRKGRSLEALVRDVMDSKLQSVERVAVAPDGEPVAKARAKLNKHNLKGHILEAVIDPPVYGEAGLTVSIRLTMWSYPERALQGAFSPKLTMAGVRVGDVGAENTLIRAAVERALDAFIASTLAG